MSATADRLTQEINLLQQYALRYAVLAAWRDELGTRRVPVDPAVGQKLETARVRIASGCVSVCEMGCALGEIEGMLASADASSSKTAVDFWLEMLGRAMIGSTMVEQLLNLPSVKFHYSGCGLTGCACGR